VRQVERRAGRHPDILHSTRLASADRSFASEDSAMTVVLFRDVARAGGSGRHNDRSVRPLP
jgi:hypothetical protein